MPIEKKAGESKSDFVGRCIKHYVDKGRDQKQAVGMCESMWETLERNEYFKEVIFTTSKLAAYIILIIGTVFAFINRRLREIKKKKKKC